MEFDKHVINWILRNGILKERISSTILLYKLFDRYESDMGLNELKIIK